MDEDWAKKNIKCCACGGTLETSRFGNIVETEKRATWKYPVSGRVDIPDYEPRAVALVCDECIQNKVKIRRCIEWEGPPYQIKYHDIESLKDGNKSVSQMRYYFGRNFRRRMLLKRARQKIEIKKNNGGLKAELSKSKNQIFSLDLPARCRQVKPSFRRMEDKKMKNPEYFRLMKNGRFIGFKRVVTEYLPAGHSTWQLDEIEHDPEETQRLSRPGVGIESLKREKITSG